jgi:hypothetical protein
MLKLLPKTVELTAALVADEQVRTDYTSTLDAIEVHAPVEHPTIEAVRDGGGEPAAEASGEVCPACGVTPSHAPNECPMAADLQDSTDELAG